MKILLDECITKKLKRYLHNYEVSTVVEMGWGGIKNGELLKKCVEYQFDILLTIDQNLSNQQNLRNHEIAVVVLKSKTSSLESILVLIPKFINMLSGFKKGHYYFIEN